MSAQTGRINEQRRVLEMVFMVGVRKRFLLGKLLLLTLCCAEQQKQQEQWKVNVGVLLDSQTWHGRAVKAAIDMAFQDIRKDSCLAPASSFLLLQQFRDCQNDTVVCAASAVDVVQRQVVAIIGPSTSEEAQFVVELGQQAKVPVLSFTVRDPLISNRRFEWFLRMTRSDDRQAAAIASVAQAFQWQRIAVIYSDDAFGRGILSVLSDSLVEVGSRIQQTSAICPQAHRHNIRAELYKLMSMESRVLVAHVNADLGIRLFAEAKDVGMMEAGYVWIATNAFTDLFDAVLNSTVAPTMQGVLGIKTHVQNTSDLQHFTQRFRQVFTSQYPDSDSAFANAGVNVLLAYDTVWAVARALESLLRSSSSSSSSSNASTLEFRNTGHRELLQFKQGPQLLSCLRQSNFSGLSGPVRFQDGNIVNSMFEIANIVDNGYKVVGYWNADAQLFRDLPPPPAPPSNQSTIKKSSSQNDLHTVYWPGGSKTVPNGWVMPTNGKRLKIATIIPRNGYDQFVSTSQGKFNQTIVTGFCRDVFDAVISRLDYPLQYDFVIADPNSTYDALVRQVYQQEIDGVVGDITITANRSNFVDFTQPFTGTGSIMVTRLQRKRQHAPFLKPFAAMLWFAITALMLVTGAVVASTEEWGHGIVKALPRGCWFAFLSLFFAHGHNVQKTVSKIIVVVWLLVLLVLTTSYTASLTSILTVHQYEAAVEDISTVQAQAVAVGYRNGSHVEQILRKQLKLTNLIPYTTLDEFKAGLQAGTSHGGVDAIFDELPYVQVLLSSHCDFVKVEPAYKTGGFGFAFSKGSPLVSDVSKALLSLSENKEMQRIQRKWLNMSDCTVSNQRVSSSSLDLDSFKFLFIGAAVASTVVIALSCKFRDYMLHQDQDQDDEDG